MLTLSSISAILAVLAVGGSFAQADKAAMRRYRGPLRARQSGSTVCGSPSQYPVSCSTSDVSNTCCTDSPGGHSWSEVQLWDTGSGSTGPNDSFTIHGLWPDNCDGTFESFCDSSRESTDITGTLQNNGQNDLLSYMQTYWVSDEGSNESFWEHEWNKHGTCISSLEPSCFTNFYQGEDIGTFFQTVVNVFQGLPTYSWLSQAGFTPSNSQTYALSDMSSALSQQFGGDVTINCDDNGVLTGVQYHYNTQGGMASGNFVPTSAVGEGSNCPSDGIQYLPKYQ